MQASYLALLDSAVGGGREGEGSGPGYLVQHEAESFRSQKQEAEERHARLAGTIEETCEPVDRRVFEQLAEEQRTAVESMLLERLLRDFDAEWDPTMSCSVKLGEHFQVGIDDTGKLSVGGKWNWLKNKYPSADHVPDEIELARHHKFNFKDGAFVGASAGLEGSAKYGPFTGKGSMTMGVAWNSQKNQWDYPVELGGTLGIGFSTKKKDPKQNISAACYPGKARVKFEARAVARDAYEYVRSLDPE
jgi:hypothetical protein